MALFLTACGGEDYVVISRSIKQYEVVRIDPPKHFFVDLKDIETGFVYKRQKVAKRCGSWRNLRIGSTWTFTEVTYKNGRTGIENVRSLCARLR